MRSKCSECGKRAWREVSFDALTFGEFGAAGQDLAYAFLALPLATDEVARAYVCTKCGGLGAAVEGLWTAKEGAL